ncbi:MAG: M28 family peptidase, partial [Chitinophagales bacterium]
YSGKDVKGKIVIAKLSSPEGYHPHTKFYAFSDERTKVQAAEKYGAAGIIFYNTDSDYTTPTNSYLIKSAAENIPVMFVSNAVANKLLKTNQPVTLETELISIEKTGMNVIGLIDNNSKKTIVIGAHYDHLGYNEMGGSLYRGEPAIHNGADDNASGTALIMELAETLAESKYQNNNYIIIAFSGEELGLYGSKFSASSKALAPFDINYMFNFDMVGRLDENKNLIINGVGTSPAFDTLEAVNKNTFVLKTTESGIGPSDHTSFYLKDNPVLHFFTGTHADYHKPTDDADKINYPGMELIYHYVMDLIGVFNNMGALPFEQTKEDTNENAPRFTVTLGVVPDYVYAGKGMRIDGVSDGKPAAEAGMQAGDVVV